MSAVFILGAAKVIVADLDGAAAKAVADSIGGEAVACDVAKEADIKHVIDETERRFGPIELFCSNAGIALQLCCQSDWQKGIALPRHLPPRARTQR